MKRLFSILIVLLIASVASALDFSQSVCTVSVKVSARESNRGSGCVFGVRNGKVYISTAGHVTDGKTAAYVEFTPNGKNGYQYPAVVERQNRAEDWAVVTVGESKFVRWVPTPIRPIQANQKIPVGSKLYFAGFSENQPLRAGVGRLTGNMIGGWVECSNPFRSGESGGPVCCVIDGEPRLIGIIVLCSIEDRTGGFTPINLAADGWRTRETSYRLCQWSECPSGNCPTYRQPRQPQPQGNRLPGWIVEEVPDPPETLTPSPERPVIVDDPNIPAEVIDQVAPNSGTPKVVLPDAKLMEMWRAEAELNAKLEARLEAANQAAAEFKTLGEAAKEWQSKAEGLAEQVEDMDRTICEMQEAAKEKAESVVESVDTVSDQPGEESDGGVYKGPSLPPSVSTGRTWPQWIEQQGWIATLLAIGSWAIWAGRGAIERRKSRKGGA